MIWVSANASIHCTVLSLHLGVEDRTVAFKTFYFSPLALMVVRLNVSPGENAGNVTSDNDY